MQCGWVRQASRQFRILQHALLPLQEVWRPAYGKTIGAHRAMCQAAHGPQPDEGYEVAHSCGNPACVNPRHLRWATTSDNQKDKRMHGTSGRKTTEEQEETIRSLKGVFSQRTIAKMFGISHTTVGQIHKGPRFQD